MSYVCGSAREIKFENCRKREKKRKEGEIRELTSVRVPKIFEHQPYFGTQQSWICNLDRISICGISRYSRDIELGDKAESAIATTNQNQGNFSFLVTYRRACWSRHGRVSSPLSLT
jgi:hypothetical protein